MQNKIIIFTIAALCLAQTACTVNSKLLNDIDLASQELVKVAPELANSNLPLPLVIAVDTTASGLACSLAFIELGGASDAQIALAVTQCGLSAVVPALPAGLDQNIANDISNLFKAVTQIFTDLQTPKTSATYAKVDQKKLYDKLHKIGQRIGKARLIIEGK